MTQGGSLPGDVLAWHTLSEDEATLNWSRPDSESGRFDHSYVGMLVVLAWSVLAAYIFMAVSGLMPVHPLALAGSAGWIVLANSLSTWHWAQRRPMPWYDAIYLYLDLASVVFVMLAVANLGYPIWLALVMLMIAAPAERPSLQATAFNTIAVAAYPLCAVILHAAGWYTVSAGVAAVTTTLLAFIAVNLAIVFEGNRRLRRVIRRLAVTDSLTGVANRRELSRFLANPPRDGANLAVIVMDVDQFKHYNDEFGHLAGDQLLVRLAGVLQESFPDAPIVSRFGGDEFVVILPCASMEDAAERVRQMLTLRERDRVPVSVGIALWPEQQPSLDAAIAAADDALRTAKRSHRGTYATSNAAGGIRLADAS